MASVTEVSEMTAATVRVDSAGQLTPTDPPTPQFLPLPAQTLPAPSPITTPAFFNSQLT